MKPLKLVRFAAWLLCLGSLTLFAQASNANGNAQAIQINLAVPNVPLLYIIHITPQGEFPQLPYEIAVGNLFVALQSVDERRKGAEYSFDLMSKFNKSLVTEYRIEWRRDGTLRDSRNLIGWHESGVNWFFTPWQSFGKNVSAIRSGYVNDILGSTKGGTTAQFPLQSFLIDGPGTYEVRITTTIDGLTSTRAVQIPVSAYYDIVR